jgi:SAM-dependent methyltransferase
LVWSAGPNRFLSEEVGGLPPGRALDLGAGEGRNAIWLAERGWDVTAVDFSRVGIEKGAEIARARGVAVKWVVEDLLNYNPEPGAFDLVILLYIHLPGEEWIQVLTSASSGVLPGGTLLVIGHDSANIANGVGGPQDASVLYNAAGVVSTLKGFDIIHAGQVLRPVATDDGERNAIDVLVRAVARPVGT